MATVELSLEEYEALRSMAHDNSCINCSANVATPENVVLHKSKRKATASNRKYAAAFKKVKGRFMKKSGGWKKNGFRNAARAAHKLARK
jgi:hypothetical protein